MQNTILSRILQHAPANRPVARNTLGMELSMTGFLAGAAVWRSTAQHLRLPNAVLYAEDAAELLPALFGCWAAGVHVILPGDALPGTLERLSAAGLTAKNTMLGLDAAAMDESCSWSIMTPECRFSDFNRLPPCADLPLLDDKAELLSLLTSGSTGEPKLIRKRLEQCFYEPEAIHAGVIERTGQSPAAWGEFEVLGTVSAQHIYGLLFRLMWPLMEERGIAVGPRLHYPESLEAALENCAVRGRKAVVISSPAHLKRFGDESLFTPSLGTAAAVFSSTGPLDDAGAINAKCAFGHFPFEVLGSTETGGIAWRQRRFTDNEKSAVAASAWKTVEGIQAAVKVESRYLPAGEGLIALSGRHLDHEGWIDGADRIALQDGLFSLLGRADRIVKIEGKRVALPEVEKLLLETGLVSNSKVFLETIRAESQRDALHAAVVLTPAGRELLFTKGKAALLEPLKTHLKRSLPAVALPRRWRFVDQLPADPQGKVTVACLRTLFDQRRPEWLIETDTVENGKRVLTLRFEASLQLAWFRRHFPDMPILPGVAQLLLVETAAREFTQVPPDAAPAQVKTLKFRAVIRPGAKLRLRLTLPASIPTMSDQDGSWKLGFEWRLINELPGAEDELQTSGTIEWHRAQDEPAA